MLADALGEAEDVEIVGTASNGAEGLELARRHRPDVVLMDVEMDVMNGIDATREIVRAVPGVRVVMLTANDDQATILDAMESGAVGYLTKDKTLIDDVVSAVRRAHGGEIMLPTALIGRLIT